MSLYEFLVERCIGIGCTVRRYKQLCTIKVWRIYRGKYDLHRPLCELTRALIIIYVTRLLIDCFIRCILYAFYCCLFI